MTINRDDNRQLWLFFAVTFAFSWLFWIPNALAAQEGALLSQSLQSRRLWLTIAAFLLTLLRQGGRGAPTAGFMISFLALAVLVILRIEGAVRLGRQRAQRERCAVYDATYNALDIAQGENQR